MQNMCWEVWSLHTSVQRGHLSRSWAVWSKNTSPGSRLASCRFTVIPMCQNTAEWKSSLDLITFEQPVGLPVVIINGLYTNIWVLNGHLFTEIGKLKIGKEWLFELWLPSCWLKPFPLLSSKPSHASLPIATEWMPDQQFYEILNSHSCTNSGQRSFLLHSNV